MNVSLRIRLRHEVDRWCIHAETHTTSQIMPKGQYENIVIASHVVARAQPLLSKASERDMGELRSLLEATEQNSSNLL